VPVLRGHGVDCIQIGEPNSKNQALLNRLRSTPLPVIHKRGNSLDTEAYLLWVERMMTGGKENVILCERGIASANRYTRNTLDCGSIAAYRYQLSGLPIAVDARTDRYPGPGPSRHARRHHGGRVGRAVRRIPIP